MPTEDSHTDPLQQTLHREYYEERYVRCIQDSVAYGALTNQGIGGIYMAIVGLCEEDRIDNDDKHNEAFKVWVAHNVHDRQPESILGSKKEQRVFFELVVVVTMRNNRFKERLFSITSIEF
jgi:hypothetical protein